MESWLSAAMQKSGERLQKSDTAQRTRKKQSPIPLQSGPHVHTSKKGWTQIYSTPKRWSWDNFDAPDRMLLEQENKAK